MRDARFLIGDFYREKLRANGEPFSELFYSSFLLIYPEIAEALPDPLGGVPAGLNKLEKAGHLLESAADDLRIGHRVEFDRLRKSLEDSEKTVKELRAAIEKAAEMSGVEMTEWTSRKELEEFVKKLAVSIRQKGVIGEELACFIRALARLISEMQIQHKSRKKAQEAMVLRDQVVGELDVKSADPASNPLPGMEVHKEPESVSSLHVN